MIPRWCSESWSYQTFCPGCQKLPSPALGCYNWKLAPINHKVERLQNFIVRLRETRVRVLSAHHLFVLLQQRAGNIQSRARVDGAQRETRRRSAHKLHHGRFHRRERICWSRLIANSHSQDLWNSKPFIFHTFFSNDPEGIWTMTGLQTLWCDEPQNILNLLWGTPY